jgi:hypothetical protein
MSFGLNLVFKHLTNHNQTLQISQLLRDNGMTHNASVKVRWVFCFLLKTKVLPPNLASVITDAFLICNQVPQSGSKIQCVPNLLCTNHSSSVQKLAAEWVSMGDGSLWHKWITAAKVCFNFLREWRSLFLISQISKNPTQSQHWPRNKNSLMQWELLDVNRLSTLGIPYWYSVRSASDSGSYVCCPVFAVDCTSIVDMFLRSNDSSTDRKNCHD